jgi:putative SOS response-associated peptidase YedK
MTARFFHRDIPWGELSDAAGVTPPANVDPPPAQFNIAPTQLAFVLRRSSPGLYIGDYAPRGAVIVQPAFWRFIPTWWTPKVSEKPYSNFTARAENLATSRAFQGAYLHGRCLIPASGFYAWAGEKGASRPFAFALADQDWFCMAGLWSRVMIEGSEIDTFAIVTCGSNRLVASCAATMPAIIRRSQYARWLDPSTHDPRAMLKPYPADEMRCWSAHPDLGDVRNQGEWVVGE